MSFKVRVGIAIVVLACVALISCGCAVTDDKREDGLLVYTLDENPSLKQVISRYEEQHPEKPVNMVVGIPEGSDISADDAIRSLNAMMAAGDVPDVLVLDGLPIDRMVDQGLLSDLSSIKERLMSDDEYFENIVFSSIGDGRYACTTQFSLPAVAGDSGWINEFDSVSELVASMEEDEFDALASGCSLFEVYSAFYPWLFTEGTVDVDMLQKLFLSEAALLHAAESWLPAEYLEEEGGYLSSSPMCFVQPNSTFSTGDLFTSEGCKLQIASIDTWTSFGTLALTTNETDYPCSYKLLKEKEAVFVPNTILGIPTNAQHNEEAEEFVAYTLSSESQKSIHGMGIPVNKSAYKELLEDNGGYAIGFMGDNGELEEHAIDALSAEDIEGAWKLIEEVHCGVAFDRVITTAVADAFNDYYNGTMNLDDAVSYVIERVGLYTKQ